LVLAFRSRLPQVRGPQPERDRCMSTTTPPASNTTQPRAAAPRTRLSAKSFGRYRSTLSSMGAPNDGARASPVPARRDCQARAGDRSRQAQGLAGRAHRFRQNYHYGDRDRGGSRQALARPSHCTSARDHLANKSQAVRPRDQARNYSERICTASARGGPGCIDTDAPRARIELGRHASAAGGLVDHR